ncbi:hypothetical protein SRABI106_02119 [Rahnella aquatilis]|nr:hypothetical protein SRABI106_02119 [Rahnella aquatilis]
MVILIKRRQTTAKRVAGQRFWREDFENTHIVRRILNKLLNAVITFFVVLHHAHQLLQAAFTQPLFHALHPLRRIEHRRRHGTDDHNGIRATAVRFFNRDRVTDASVLIADTIQIHPHAVKARNST